MMQSKALQNTEPIDGEIVTTSDTALAISEALPLDQHPAVVYLAGLSTKNSRNTMRRGLEAIATLLGYERQRTDKDGNLKFNKDGSPKMVGDFLAVAWHELRFQHTNTIKAQLTGMYSAATVNNFLSALRGVLLTAKRLKLMSVEDYDNAVSIKGVKGSTLPSGRDIDDKEIRRLFAVCEADSTPSGARDAAILAIMRLGLRVTEITKLTLDDINRSDDNQWTATIKGKGNKERAVYISNGSLQALKDWLKVRGYDSSAVFNPITRYDVIEDRHLSRQAIFKMCNKRASEAKIADFSPHDFRRTFVGDMLDLGVDIVTVKDLAGHSSIQTTARYDRRDDKRKQDAVRLLNTPYMGRRQKSMDLDD